MPLRNSSVAYTLKRYFSPEMCRCKKATSGCFQPAFNLTFDEVSIGGVTTPTDGVYQPPLTYHGLKFGTQANTPSPDGTYSSAFQILADTASQSYASSGSNYLFLYYSDFGDVPQDYPHRPVVLTISTAGKGAIKVASMFVSQPGAQTSSSVDIQGSLGNVAVAGCSQTSSPPAESGQLIKFEDCVVDTLTITSDAIIDFDGDTSLGLDTIEVCATGADSALTLAP